MKYVKPDLHLISIIDAAAHCTNGSTPGVAHECSNGDTFSVTNCNDGAQAHAACTAGNAAASNCGLGNLFGQMCANGGTP